MPLIALYIGSITLFKLPVLNAKEIFDPDKRGMGKAPPGI